MLIQPMRTGGVEVLAGVVQEPVFGPLVVFGLGGVASDVLGDRVARLTPLTDTDAAELVHAVRAAPLLLGQRGGAAVDSAALTDVLLRISRLADDLPEIAELDLNPVIAGLTALAPWTPESGSARRHGTIHSCGSCAECRYRNSHSRQPVAAGPGRGDDDGAASAVRGGAGPGGMLRLPAATRGPPVFGPAMVAEFPEPARR